METTEIKSDLHNKIENVASGQLKDIYGLIINYLNGADASEEWDLLTDFQQKKIMQGYEQASAGLGKPAKEGKKSEKWLG